MSLLKQHKAWAKLHGYIEPIKSVAEFNDALEKMRLYGDVLKEPLFRGEPKLYEDSHLSPSILRHHSPEELKSVRHQGGTLNITEQEQNEIKSCIAENPELVEKFGLSGVQWIPYAQHYGKKTRLLDLTLNPLIALYFACSKHASDHDGAVFWLMGNSLRPQQRKRNELDDSVFEYEIEQTIPESYYELFEPWSRRRIHEGVVHYFKPFSDHYRNNERMRAQQGVFAWWHPLNGKAPTQNFVLIIDKASKHKILIDLAHLGIDEVALMLK